MPTDSERRYERKWKILAPLAIIALIGGLTLRSCTEPEYHKRPTPQERPLIEPQEIQPYREAPQEYLNKTSYLA